ncbi:MAG: TonB-dependent receptor [Bacteroidota bacterium]
MKKLAVLVSIIVFWGTSLLGQAIVIGKVMDNEGVTLPGANVYLKGNNIGTTTDINGEYALTNVPFGEQIIVISYLGFETVEQSAEVVEGQVNRLNVKLVPAAVLSKEVIITGQALGQAKAINQQLNAESIANIVSADRIQELPDVNAAEAIGRLPGISLNRSGGEGQKVVIRGMEPKFAAITVNGVNLPSNDGGDRSVDLSLIAPELLDGIEVYKSPLPDMDAEAVGGTVNLRLRKAPEELKVNAKGLWGFNRLHDEFRDYKGTLQISKRVFNNKLGVIAQGSIERFNRGSDETTYNWRQGPTNQETGITAILGNRLELEDRQEIRKRYNASLGLDYPLGAGSISLFGLYSRTDRDRFNMTQRFDPSEPSIEYRGQGIESQLDLYNISMNGEHPLGKLIIDWSLSTAQTDGMTPYNLLARFPDTNNSFDPNLNPDAPPSTFLAAASPALESANLRSVRHQESSTSERNNQALLNFKIPFTSKGPLDGYFKFGGKYKQITRERKVDVVAEDFYYLGGQFTRDAIALYDGKLDFLSANSELISITSFLKDNTDISFEGENNEQIQFDAEIDEDLIRAWYESQIPILNNDRSALNDNYEVDETVTAGYAMLKLNIGKKLSIIPGVRYEYSDNEYSAGISSLNGRYGGQGFFVDTLTTQTYGEILPHLHIKFKPTTWFDIRASYATTLARPDFNWITPSSEINNTSTIISTGNPTLSHARAQNYDLFFSAYKGGIGLLTFGVFYKDIDNIFYPFSTLLADQETAESFGWPNNRGYEFRSFVNSDVATVYGYEIDLQTNLSFLPKPLDGLVLNANYSRLFSETEVFFFTVEQQLIQPFPPIFETIVTNLDRQVQMISQVPHIFNASLGYDLKNFSARVSCIYQASKANGYSRNKDFDTFTLELWRWDASAKYKIGNNWSIFLNLNNISNQQDITFTRNENFLNNIQTYGMTGTTGIQFRL